MSVCVINLGWERNERVSCARAVEKSLAFGGGSNLHRMRIVLEMSTPPEKPVPQNELPVGQTRLVLIHGVSGACVTDRQLALFSLGCLLLGY